MDFRWPTLFVFAVTVETIIMFLRVISRISKSGEENSGRFRTLKRTLWWSFFAKIVNILVNSSITKMFDRVLLASETVGKWKYFFKIIFNLRPWTSYLSVNAIIIIPFTTPLKSITFLTYHKSNHCHLFLCFSLISEMIAWCDLHGEVVWLKTVKRDLGIYLITFINETGNWSKTSIWSWFKFSWRLD